MLCKNYNPPLIRRLNIFIKPIPIKDVAADSIPTIPRTIPKYANIFFTLFFWISVLISLRTLVLNVRSAIDMHSSKKRMSINMPGFCLKVYLLTSGIIEINFKTNKPICKEYMRVLLLF
jgi:hypothetical protein